MAMQSLVRTGSSTPRRVRRGWAPLVSPRPLRLIIIILTTCTTLGLLIWSRPRPSEAVPVHAVVTEVLPFAQLDKPWASVETSGDGQWGQDVPPKKPFAQNVTAELVPPEIWPRSLDACAEALGIPKVALMFLTRGDLHLSPAWRLWFQSAAGVLPRAAARCGASPPSAALLKEACSGPGPLQASSLPDEEIIDAQHLFTVYVHAPPSANMTTTQSLFLDRLIQKRTETTWGSMNLVYAARLLLWEAYRDPANARFVLLSESDIPLYDPRTFHHQLTHETLSRTSACPATMRDLYRWNRAMESGTLRQKHWRKASQWFMVTREHARVVLDDVHVFRKFEAYCYSGWDPDVSVWRNCYSDEHYLATLFAVHGLQQDANCDVWGIAAVDWGNGGAHPRSYRANDTTPDLINAIRTRFPCQAPNATKAAQPLYEVLDAGALAPDSTWECPEDTATPSPLALPPVCSLTARKFPSATANEVRAVFESCDARLQLIDPGLCRPA